MFGDFWGVYFFSMILCQELGRQATLSTGLMFGGKKLGECRHCRTGGLIHVSKHGNERQGAVGGLGWVPVVGGRQKLHNSKVFCF